MPGLARPHRGGAQGSFIEAGRTRPNDFLARSIDFTAFDHAKIGPYWVRTLFITAFPREVDLGFLDPLTAFAGDVDTAIHVIPLDERDSIDEITRVIARLEAEDALRGTNIRFAQEMAQAHADAKSLRLAIQNNITRLHRVAVIANLYGRDLASLDDLQRLVLAQLAGRRIHPQFAEGRMEEGLLAVSPLGLNPMDDSYHTMDSFALSATLPFLQADLLDQEGIPLGWNKITGNPVLYDPWALENQNGVIYAAPGAGKSSTLRMLIARARLMGVRVVVFDVEGEHGKVTEAMGGVRIRIGARKSPEIVNVGDLLPDQEEDGTESVSVQEKALDLSGMFQFGIPGMTPQEVAVLERAIADEYTERGLDTAEGLYEQARVVTAGAYRRGKRMKPMPTISDFAARLRRPEYAEELPKGGVLLPAIARFERGGVLGFFDGETNVDVENAPVITFDLADLRDAGKAFAFYVVLGWVWEHFVKRRDGQNKLLVVDESWMLVDGGVGSHWLNEMARRCRKRDVGFFIVSHDIETFEDDKEARMINKGAATKIFMRQQPTTAQAMRMAFQLPEGEIDWLTKHAEKGDATLHAGARAVMLHFEPTEAEAPWVHEKPRSGAAQVPRSRVTAAGEA